MTKILTYTLLGVYIAIMICIGFYSYKKTKTVSDFVLGGRSVGPWLTAFAYGTSYFSAVVFIGYAGQFGWSYGISAFWIGIGNAVIGSALAWVVLGRRTRLMTHKLNAKTMPEFFEKRFNSKALKLASSLIIFIFLIPYTASVYNGLSRLFDMALGIQSENSYMIIIVLMALITAVYVILGGYSATAINDFIQGIIMLAGIIAVIICTVNHQGGLTESIKKLGEIETDGGGFNKLFGPSPLNLIGVIILTSLGTWGLPQMIGKFYAIKDEGSNKIIRSGTIISTIFALVVAGGSYFIGGFARLFCTADPSDTSKNFIETLPNGKLDFDSMIPSLINTALPNILIALVVVLVFSASMSTLSSLVLTSSSTLTIDFIKPKLKKEISEKKEVVIMRILIAVFLIISVVIAFNKNASISTLMSYSWGALAGAFLGPFMFGLFYKKTTKLSVWVSFATGIGLTVGHMILFGFGWFPELAKHAASLPLNLASPINAGAIVMILSIIIVPVVSAFSHKPDETKVNEFFECYNEK